MRHFNCISIIVLSAFLASTGNAATNAVAKTVSGKLSKADCRVVGDTVKLTAQYTLSTTNTRAYFPYCSAVYLMEDKRDKTRDLNSATLDIKGNDPPDRLVDASLVKTGTAMFRTTEIGYSNFRIVAWRIELWSAPQHVEGSTLLDVKICPATDAQHKALGVATDWYTRRGE
jgi:hypothetical protein